MNVYLHSFLQKVYTPIVKIEFAEAVSIKALETLLSLYNWSEYLFCHKKLKWFLKIFQQSKLCCRIVVQGDWSGYHFCHKIRYSLFHNSLQDQLNGFKIFVIAYRKKTYFVSELIKELKRKFKRISISLKLSIFIKIAKISVVEWRSRF